MVLDWSILWGNAGVLILQGLLVTLKLSAVSLAGAFVLGLVFGTVRWLGFRVTEPICWLYVELSRNTPPVVQILFWYFSASVILPEWLFIELRGIGYEFGAAVVALSIYHGGFLTEIVRAGLNAVPKGQFEAARALGQSFWQSFSRVMFPQAARILAPTLVNEAASLVKNTSLAVAVGVAELTYQYKYIDNFQFRGIEALTAVTAVYFLLCLAIAGLGKLTSQRLSRHVVARGALPRALAAE
jgi:polar amino acid transport system permease protein